MFCLACGEKSIIGKLCQPCELKKETFTKCQNKKCSVQCPQRFCVTCNIQYVKTFRQCTTIQCKNLTKYQNCRQCNWEKTWTSCIKCQAKSPKKVCQSCAEANTCQNCLKKCPFQFCKKCHDKQQKNRLTFAKYQCIRCQKNSPTKVCKSCTEANNCENCSKKCPFRFCQECHTMTKKIPSFRTCEADNCQNTTTKKYCRRCYSYLDQYIYKRD
jgi:hypothetical protein